MIAIIRNAVRGSGLPGHKAPDSSSKFVPRRKYAHRFFSGVTPQPGGYDVTDG
jgi:hypothetical protein